MIADLQNILRANILAIDDEEINLEIIEELLADNGFSNITLFSDPEAALESYRQSPPDLVLLLDLPVFKFFTD